MSRTTIPRNADMIAAAVIAMITALCFATAAHASESDTASEAETSHASHDESGPHAPHHRHHLSAFAGGGFRPHDGPLESGFVIGLDYQYRFTSWLSTGALVEAATGDLRELVVIAPITVKPWRGLNLVVGPGAELRRDDPAEFLFRIGAIYLWQVDHFTVGPEFAIDVVEGHPTYVTGLVFGVGF